MTRDEHEEVPVPDDAVTPEDDAVVEVTSVEDDVEVREAAAPEDDTTVDEGAEPAPAPVRRAAQAGRIVVRAGSALLVLATVAAVAVGGSVRSPAAPTAVALPEVSVPAAGTTLVCPGPLRLPTEPEPGEDVAYDPQFDPTLDGTTTLLRALTLGGAAGTLRPMAEDDVVAELDPVGEAAVATLDDVDGPVVLRAEPQGDEPAGGAASVLSTTTEGDLRGLASASCARATPEAWLVGGSTAVGSSARLVLQNPGLTAATAEVTIWGPSGRVELAGAPEFLVPPGQERVVLLEGVAAEQRRLVTRVRASGGLVTAYIQDSELRGLVPAGVDLVTTGSGPDAVQRVPGIVLPETQADGADPAVLRLLAPGDERVSVDVTLLGSDGPLELPGAQGLDLTPGEVLDVPLGGLPAGAYTVLVSADGPVVAGALLTRGLGVGDLDQGTLATDPLDRAWMPSAVASDGAAVALPGTDGALAVGVADPGSASGGAAQVTLDVLDVDGGLLGSRDLDLQPDTTTAIPLDGLLGEAGEAPTAEGSDAEVSDAVASDVVAGVVLRTDDPRVVWSVVLVQRQADGTLVSTLTPVAAETVQPDVGVRVR